MSIKPENMKKFVLIIAIALLGVACQKKGEKIVRMETSLGTIRLKLYDETAIHRDNMVKLVEEGYYDGMLFHRVIRDFMIQAGDPASKGARPGMLLGEQDAGYTLRAEILPVYFHKKGVLAAAREGDNINPERESSGSHFYIVQGKVFSSQELTEAVEKINERRYTALFERLKTARQGEIARYQIAEDYEKLMKINEELSEAAREQFKKVELRLTEEQIAAYTTVGGTPHLDGEYTVFGEVIEGLEIVDKIAGVETDDHARPLKDVVIQKMVVE